MSVNLEVLLGPAEYETRRTPGFAGTTCVVFDVFRATSVMITGLANGARSFIPVTEIPEALAWRARQPDVLLAGERDGLRIKNAANQGIDFDLGNSPREYQSQRVSSRDIVTTTTNGTRALRTCAPAEQVLVGSFLNLTATATWLQQIQTPTLVLVGAGTGVSPALEDILCAGALVTQLQQSALKLVLDDAAELARLAYQQAAGRLEEVAGASRNGRRLRANPELHADVSYCLQQDRHPVVARLDGTGYVTRVT